LLGDVRAVIGLEDVLVRGQAGDQEIRLALRVHEMPEVTGVDDVEGAVAHDHGACPRPRPDDLPELGDGLDLVLVPRPHRGPRVSRGGPRRAAAGWAARRAGARWARARGRRPPRLSP